MIHFGTGTTAILHQMREAGGDVIGIDWRVHLDEAWTMVGHDRAVQGNLDPLVLFAPLHEIERRVEDILRRAGGALVISLISVMASCRPRQLITWLRRSIWYTS